LKLYSLGTGRNEFSLICKTHDISSQAQKQFENPSRYNQSAYIDPRTFQIISIHVVPLSNSNSVCLLAIACSGIRHLLENFCKISVHGLGHRIYFSLSYDGYQKELLNMPRKTPVGMNIKWVKAPPPGEKFQIHESCYSNGTLVVANSTSEDFDSISFLCSEVGHDIT
jgi:hypothetical protein